LLYGFKKRDNGLLQIRFLDGSSVEIFENPKQKRHEDWRATAASLQRNTVRVPEYLAPICTRQKLIWLRDYLYLGEENENPLIRVALVEPSGELMGIDQERPLAGYKLSYDSILGYVAIKKQKSLSFE
jgi:CRISPR-associated endonuclease/helicase Cas3